MIEAIKKELLEKGFTYNESSKLWYYEYSEFEVLRFVIHYISIILTNFMIY